MEDCPYCGAENPEDALTCQRCNAILKEVDEDEIERIAKDNPVDVPDTDLIPCPKCGAMQGKKAKRCTECGTTLRQGPEVESHDSFKMGIYAAFGGVALLVFLVILIIGFLGAPDEKREYVKISPAILARKYSEKALRSGKTKAQKAWEKKYLGKYVTWKCKVVSVDGDRVEFAVTSDGVKSNKAEVRVDFVDDAASLIPGIAKGKMVTYDAKLVSYNEEGYRFLMENGSAPESE